MGVSYEWYMYWWNLSIPLQLTEAFTKSFEFLSQTRNIPYPWSAVYIRYDAVAYHLRPLLLTPINFNPTIDK